MQSKLFQQVFQNVSLSPNVTEAFSQATVRELKIQKQEKKLVLHITSPKIVPEPASDTLEADLLRQLPGIEQVSLNLNYALETETPQETVARLWDNVLYCIRKESPICNQVLRDAPWELRDNRLVVRVRDNMAYFLSQKGVDQQIRRKLHQETGLDIAVVLKDIPKTEAERAAYQAEQEKKAEALVKQAAIPTIAAIEGKKTEKPSPQGVILGKPITAAATSLMDAKTEGEQVVVEGYVFNVEAKETKTGRYIFTFDLTDHTDSVTVKLFATKEQYADKLSPNVVKGAYLKVKGDLEYDRYSRELTIITRDLSFGNPPAGRMDTYEGEKRVELHLHTQMSSMDGITTMKDYVKRAVKWGHKAIAVTDHGVVQAFPDAMHAAEKEDIKIIYGVEAYLIDDLGTAVQNPKGQTIDDTFVVFDIETTGLSWDRDAITELGAVKLVDGRVVDRFQTFVNPKRHIPEEITKLTRITDEMVADAPTIEEMLPDFLAFAGDAVLVAHNAGFDVSFIRIAAERQGLPEVGNTVLDTLELSRSLMKELSKHKLDLVAEALEIPFTGHHRAVNDAEVTAKILVKFLHMLAEQGAYTLEQVNAATSRVVNMNKLKHYHAILLAKNAEGLRNLYELVSASHLQYYSRRPRIPKSLLMRHREGLILGSACEAGELYRALLDKKPKEVVKNLANFYDYLEIQPLGNNAFMISSDKVPGVNSYDDIIALNKQIIALGEELGKPVVATCDVHFIDPEDAAYRKIIMAYEGFKDADNQAPLYFRTTREMLDEFSYLSPEKAREVVIENPNKIADMVEKIRPIPEEKCPPVIPGSDEELRQITTDCAHSIYGDPLPEIVEKRLNRELDSIIKNGYAVMYIIAQKLVKNSMEHGYLVGSRGSVGSSFVATMSGITEVNPLPPHYVCPNCKYSDFTSDITQETLHKGGSGCDMPDADCPVCGAKMRKEGHDIPFETFLGFNGDKEPDIDLNFSGEYQQQIHVYTETLLGEGQIFKAGTISTLKEKTAQSAVLKYYESKGQSVSRAEVRRLAEGCTGVKRTTGQHPGGLIVVPRGHSILEFTPVQRPANDVHSTVTTTHFDYHSFNEQLLKLDLLGHDDPTMIRMLYDLTGVNPQSVHLDDPDVMSLFASPAALGVTEEEINCKTGTFGIPEFGTRFTRQMLMDTKPKQFSDLVRISGLSHGTNVYNGNAQDLIKNGVCTLQECISTRDSIMGYLITKGLPNLRAFKIMEKVRKGKEDLSEEEVALMKEHGVPDWYIDSCNKIKYMFPKAHAVAYVMMAVRIGYFKIHHPLAYYASYFSIRAKDDFDYDTMCMGPEAAKAEMRAIAAKGMDATAKDEDKQTVLELILEFYARGFTFTPIDLYRSQADKFAVTEGGLIPPFSALRGLGGTAAQSIVEGRDSGGPFNTIEELKERTGIGKTLIQLLKDRDVLKGIPETNQLTLF